MSFDPRRMADSSRDFIGVVWPAIAKWCGDGQLVPCETDRSSITGGLVDRYAGVDYWQIQDAEGRMRGLASRVQYGTAWSSFTIRSELATGGKTELEKRLAAIQQGWLVPALTVQAYVTSRDGTGSLLAAAVVYTRDLYAYVAKLGGDAQTNPNDGNKFVAVWWDDLRDAGFRVRTHGEDTCRRPRRMVA